MTQDWTQGLVDAFQPYAHFVETIEAGLRSLSEQPQEKSTAPKRVLSEKHVLISCSSEFGRILLARALRGLPVKITQVSEPDLSNVSGDLLLLEEGQAGHPGLAIPVLHCSLEGFSREAFQEQIRLLLWPESQKS